MEESFSGVRVSFGGSKVTFPLPKGYFPDVRISEEQTQEYRDLIRHRLDAALSDEKCCHERLDHGLQHLSPNDWKSMRSFDGLQLFQRRRRGRKTAELAAEEDFPQAVNAVTRGQASVVAIGSIPGTIEDVLYGFAGTSDEETRTSLSFLLRKTDAAVLRTFEVGTDKNPLHYFGLKWLYAAKTVRAARDICCLHAMGVDTDESGKSYGYLVLHSVELPECPPFHKKSKVVRGSVFFTCIFRETTPGFVDVFARGILDMSGGRRLFPMTRCTTNAFIGSLRRLIDCAEAKKLTLLARRTASEVNVGEPLVQLPPLPKRAACAVCIKLDGSGLLAGTHLHTCRVCGIPVCAKCQVKNKRVFLGYDRPWSVVPCCPKCVLEAQRLTNIRPFEIEFSVTADLFVRTSTNLTPVAMTSFGLSLAEQVTRCVGLSGASDPISSRNVAEAHVLDDIESSTVARDSDAASFSDSLSDLGASQICPRISSNEIGTGESRRAEAQDKDDRVKEDEQLPAVVEELLRTEAKSDCRREQVEFTRKYLQTSPSPRSSSRTRTTIADFRGQVPILSSLEEFRERNRSEGSEATSRRKEVVAKLQQLQSTADQIYGEVVSRNADKC